MAQTRTIIIGGGFGGVQCAKTLRKSLSARHHQIILFNKENHMVFHPLLPEVAGGSLNPDAVTAPLRQMLPGISCRTEEVIRVDLNENRVEYISHDGRPQCMSYDHVILACGSVVNLGMIPGMSDHGFPLKTVGDAMNLRHHIMQQLEKADVCEDPELKERYLTFVIVGGGFSGVEVAGEINDFLKDSRRFYPNLKKDKFQVYVIEFLDSLLASMPPKLRVFVQKKMEKEGLGIFLKTSVRAATPEGVLLSDNRFVKAGTVVCTIGNSAPALIKTLDAPKQKGRLLTDPDLKIKNQQNAWAVGDCAWITNYLNQSACPPTGQFAERQGQRVAENIRLTMAGRKTEPFSFKPFGQLCSIGGHAGVADLRGFRLSGFLAWFLWRCIYLFKLPTWARRFKVGFEWVWETVFSRDLVHPKADLTTRISNASYQPGDVIFQEGDPSANFYVIEKGQVEVLHENVPLATLKEGDFFGEMSLVDNRPHQNTVRAMTAVELVVMGRHVFDQLNVVGPLKNLITEAIQKRRTSNISIKKAA